MARGLGAEIAVAARLTRDSLGAVAAQVRAARIRTILGDPCVAGRIGAALAHRWPEIACAEAAGDQCARDAAVEAGPARCKPAFLRRINGGVVVMAMAAESLPQVGALLGAA
jgi:hypothetical protein